MGKHVWTGRFKSLNVGVVEGEPINCPITPSQS